MVKSLNLDHMKLDFLDRDESKMFGFEFCRIVAVDCLFPSLVFANNFPVSGFEADNHEAGLTVRCITCHSSRRWCQAEDTSDTSDTNLLNLNYKRNFQVNINI